MTNQETYDIKVLEVMDLLLPPNSATVREILNLKKVDWKVSEEHVYKYIKRAREELKKINGIDKQDCFNKSLLRLNKLYSDAEGQGKTRDALEVVKEINKLLDLYEAEKKEIKININPKELTDEELIKLINDE